MENMKMLYGSGNLVKNPNKCRHKDCGWFLYFNDKEYSYIFECEVNPDDHDFEFVGKWGVKNEINNELTAKKDWAFELYGELYGK